MLTTLRSFLLRVSRLGKRCVLSSTEKLSASRTIFAAAAVVAAVVTLVTGIPGEGGRNPLTVYAETAWAPSQEESSQAGEMELLTEAKIPYRLIDLESRKEGQMLAGATVLKGAVQQQEAREEIQEEIVRTKEEIQQVEAEREQAAAEEAARLAEEERLRQEAEARKASALVNYSDKDYEVLKRIVQAESGGCDLKGRILIANVIINRVKSGEFPDDITSVVYQKSQFSPVVDGSLNSCKVSDLTVEAVNRALAGEDYSQGALYFMNRSLSQRRNVSWFDGHLTYLFQHEKHEFFK